MKLVRTPSFRCACSLSLALVSLGCGGDDAKRNVDAGSAKSPLDGDHAKEEPRDAAASHSDGAGDGDGDDRQDEAGPSDGMGDGDGPDPSTGACTKDAHEPDDTLVQVATGKPINGITPIEITGLTACAQDTDLIWAGPVDNGAKAAAELTWDAAEGSLELSLLDADGEPISYLDVSTQQAGRSEVGVHEFYGGADNTPSVLGSDNYFYVRVHNPGKASVPYTLKVTAQVFGP